MPYEQQRNVDALAQKDYQLQVAQQKELQAGMTFIDRYVNRQYLINLDVHPVTQIQSGSSRHMRLYHITKLIYDANEDVNDKLMSVFGALNTIGSNLIFVIRSSTEGIDFYIGTNCPLTSTAGSLLENGLKGNFSGSQLTALKSDEIDRLVQSAAYSDFGSRPSVSSVTLVPSLRDGEKEKYVQGIEKLIDAMKGEDYTAILIAEPLPPSAIEMKKRGLEEMYATISPFSETTLAYGNNASHAVANGTFSSFSDSINNSVTNSNSETQSESTTDSQSSSSGSSSGFSSSGESGGSSVSFNSSSSSSTSQTYGSSLSWSHAVTAGQTKTTSSGINQTVTDTIGESRTITIKHVNKSVVELMNRIDEELERIRACESFGLWSCAAYFISSDLQVCMMAASSYKSLIAGDDSYLDKAYINLWDSSRPENTGKIINSIIHGRHPIIQIPRSNQFEEQRVKPTVLVSGKELPIFMSFPRKSVPGIVVDEMASFGRAVFNPYERSDTRKIDLGRVMHKGIIDEHLPVKLDLEELRSHCFITGSTGSGKSNTTYRLLEDFVGKNINFLVVEPAKGEYKLAFGGLPGINVFWTANHSYPLLRLNPFSFPPNIHVLEHMDRLIEIFNACWPLYSAMPAILKEAVERAYASVGWDLLNSVRIPIGSKAFPTFIDLLRELPKVINESSYSADTKGDYTGALVTRVKSLTNGIMGSVFCSGNEIDENVLFDQNTIVDLSRVGASETKSLLMGIMVMKLVEHRMSKGEGMNAALNHVTILEEAHNLLKRVNTEQSGESANVAGKSVEMISNAIAEMRTYGEGFIIVDQSPTSVDISAIKNTNTKIVMRLTERADFEAVGNSFALTEDQIREISRLPRGVAIVSQSGWLEPVMTSIHRAGDAYVRQPQRRLPDPKDDTVWRFIQRGLNHADNNSFSEHAMKIILRNSQLSDNRRADLMNSYMQLQQSCAKEGKMTAAEHARFVIECIGCAGLADIIPIQINPKVHDVATAKTIYGRWRQKIADTLQEYGDFGSEDARMDIATQLFMYAALVQEKKSYIVGRQLLIS